MKLICNLKIFISLAVHVNKTVQKAVNVTDTRAIYFTLLTFRKNIFLHFLCLLKHALVIYLSCGATNTHRGHPPADSKIFFHDGQRKQSQN